MADILHRFPTLLGSNGGGLETDGIVDLFKLLLEFKGVLVDADEVGIEGHAVSAVVMGATHATLPLMQDILKSQLRLILHYLLTR